MDGLPMRREQGKAVDEFCKFEYHKRFSKSDLSDTQLRVLANLWNYSDESGRRASPGVERLAKDARRSEKTIRTALDDLCRLGWLDRRSRGYGRGGKASEYWLTYPAIAVTQTTGIHAGNTGNQTAVIPVIEGEIPVTQTTAHQISTSDQGSDQDDPWGSIGKQEIA